MARPSMKESIIDAAEDVVFDVGPNHLTLEAVAEKAGVSKGGLLYHFPSKEALLAGMMGRCVDQYYETRAQFEDDIPHDSAHDLKAHLLATTRSKDERARHVSAALLAVLANNRELLEPLRERHRKTFESLVETDGEIDLDVAVVCLAADGLSLLELIGFQPFEPADRKRVVERLLERAAEVKSPEE